MIGEWFQVLIFCWFSAVAACDLLIVRSFYRHAIASTCAEGERTRVELEEAFRDAYTPNLMKRLLLLAVGMAVVFGLDEMLCRFGMNTRLAMAASVVPTPILFWLGCWWLRRDMQRFAWRRLAERGVLVCLFCGYDLRAQTECRCPECGKAFDPPRRTFKPDALSTSVRGME